MSEGTVTIRKAVLLRILEKLEEIRKALRGENHE